MARKYYMPQVEARLEDSRLLLIIRPWLKRKS